MAARRAEEYCYRCGHVWIPRRRRPRICARCKSPYFWLPRVKVPTFGTGLGIEEVIGKNRARILRLARAYGATNVRIFGSVARKEASASSDIDILVDRIGGRDFRPLGLARAISRALGRKVDLVAEDNLFWLVQPRVVTEAIPL